MNCPICGAQLVERKTSKDVLFLVCERWPKCRASGTPELLKRMVPEREPRGPTRLGDLVVPLAKLRVLQAQLKQAKTDEERQRIRGESKSVLYPVP